MKVLYEGIQKPEFESQWENFVSIYAIIIWFYKSGYYTIILYDFVCTIHRKLIYEIT